MTESINDLPRPELCKGCATEAFYCDQCEDGTFAECRLQRKMWDSGYAAGKAASREECTLLAASLKQADKRAEAAERERDRYRDLYECYSGGCDREIDRKETWKARAEAAEAAYREADARCERLELDYTAEMSAREAEAKLAELVRDVREWRAERFGPAILDAILAKYDKPEGG